MKLARRLIILSVLVLLPACAEKLNDHFPGHVEAEYVRLSSPISGTLTRLYVQRGDQVEQNAPAFVLEQDNERAAREEALAHVQRAQAELANLQKGTSPDEVAATQAQLTQAEAALQSSSANLARQKKRLEKQLVSAAALHEARAALNRDRARVNELRAQLQAAKPGARSDEIDAAEQELKTAEAQLAQADWQLMQKTQRVPVEGMVTDVLYPEGERVQAGSPIVTILSPRNIKVRFFVPEQVLGKLRLGQKVVLQCDGCKRRMPAKISYLPNATEHAPPLSYGEENRSTPAFMVEARTSIEDAQALHPGQQVDIKLGEAMR
jgi:HlyD family secretion protein